MKSSALALAVTLNEDVRSTIGISRSFNDAENRAGLINARLDGSMMKISRT